MDTYVAAILLVMPRTGRGNQQHQETCADFDSSVRVISQQQENYARDNRSTAASGWPRTAQLTYSLKLLYTPTPCYAKILRSGDTLQISSV